MNVLITGATGFIGSQLVQRLQTAGHRPSVLTRDPERARAKLPGIAAAHPWSPLEGPPPAEALRNVDAVVHLAGEPVNGRWTEAKKRAIRDSRVVGTRNLVAAIGAAETPPSVLVSGSAIGFYGDRGDERLTEESAPGDDFLADTCKAWEAEADRAREHGVRVRKLRTGIVLEPGGGALDQMLLPARLGLSGPLGSGRQWWSWVHMDDEIGLIEHALTVEGSGPLNATAPEPVRQKEFAKTLGRVLGRPAFLPAPAFALKVVLGGFAVELLSSKRVLPEATQASGYRFRHPELEEALRDLL